MRNTTLDENKVWTTPFSIVWIITTILSYVFIFVWIIYKVFCVKCDKHALKEDVNVDQIQDPKEDLAFGTKEQNYAFNCHNDDVFKL
jgi:hypothetical protein